LCGCWYRNNIGCWFNIGGQHRKGFTPFIYALSKIETIFPVILSVHYKWPFGGESLLRDYFITPTVAASMESEPKRGLALF
jgi:hypothetical protein